MLKKIDVAQQFLVKNHQLFACPKCLTKMAVHGQELICQNHHSFTLSKKGTLFFLEKKMTTEYTKEMFLHRKNIIQQGLYEPLLSEIAQMMIPDAPVLDVGCGEGSFLEILGKNIRAAKIGFDISKEGIYLATEQTTADTFFCVADLTHLPFSNQQFGTILNIFSPSNYHEFARVLKPGGQLIKVIPNQFYLKELRQALYTGEKATYSNAPVLKKLRETVNVLQEKNLTYTLPTSNFTFSDLVKMTPLSWSADEKQLAELFQKPFSTITVDVTVAICQL